MNKLRVKHEVNAIQEAGMGIQYNRDEGPIEIQRFPLPPEWEPETTTILFDIPYDYPHTRPVLYVPENLKRQDDQVKRELFFPPNSTGWKRFEDYEIGDWWDSERHGIITLLRYFKAEVYKGTSFSFESDGESDTDEEDAEDT